MSDEERRPDSQKSRQELLDEIYYLRDVAGEREQRIRLLEARNDRTLQARIWRWTAHLRGVARILRRCGLAGASLPRVKAKPALVVAESRDGEKEKRLYVDVTALALHGGMTGVQRVTREILRALLASPPDGYVVKPIVGEPRQPYRIAPTRHSREDGNPESSYFDNSRDNGSGSSKPSAGQSMDPRPGDAFLGLDHSLDAVVEHERDFDLMRRRGVRIWFVCNDTLPLDHPGWFPAGVPQKFEAWLRVILRTADGVACISRTTEASVSRWFDAFGIQRDRPIELAHFGLGAEPLTRAELAMIGQGESALLERLRGKTTFLMVGTLEPRKGHAQALEAFNQLWAAREEVLLVIAGLPGWMTEVTQRRIRHHEEFGKRLFWFMDASDALLEDLYRTCTALLAPSEGEGFGLPLVEAARHGLPILCRNLPVFSEVADAHATYFEGRDPESLARAVGEWLDAWQRGAVPDSRGLHRLSWAESARQLMEVVMQAPAAAQSPPS